MNGASMPAFALEAVWRHTVFAGRLWPIPGGHQRQLPGGGTSSAEAESLVSFRQRRPAALGRKHQFVDSTSSPESCR